MENPRRAERHKIQYWWSDNWNAFGIATTIIAIAAIIISWWSYLYTKRTYDAQLKTEEHTTNAPVDIQLWKLKDMSRHFYRNLVCTTALILKFKAEGPEKKRGKYPSENNLKKLQALPDDVVLHIDIDKSKDTKNNPYRHSHELKLLLRNYNEEIIGASHHLARPSISDESLIQDFDNLMFKPLHLVKSMFTYEKSLPLTSEGDIVSRTILIMLKEHFKKLKDPMNFKLLFEKSSELSLTKLLNSKDIHEAFKTEVDYKEGLSRSLNNLLKYGMKNSTANSLVTYEVQGNNAIIAKFKKKNEVMKGLETMFIEDSENSDEQERKKEGKDFYNYISEISSITDSQSLTDFINKYYKESTTKTGDIEVLYKNIAPYLNYLKGEEWEFNTLIKLIIALDAAIETERIGMINYF